MKNKKQNWHPWQKCGAKSDLSEKNPKSSSSVCGI